MAVYRTQTIPVEGVVHVAYSGAEGMAKKHRRALMEKFNLKMADVTYETVEPKGGKAGLIDFLNKVHAQVPGTYDPDKDPGVGVVEPAPAEQKKSAKKAAKKPSKKK